jgi:hypothetical protein
MTTPSKKLSPGLATFIEERVFNSLLFREEIQNILKKQSQPLTIPEIKALVSKETGRNVDKMTMYTHVKELINEGNLISRVETVEERVLRAKNRVTTGKFATLYITPRTWSQDVPARTVAEAVPGVVLSSTSDRRPRKPKAKKRGRPIGSKNKTKTEAKTDNLHDLVAQVVKAHQTSISQELEETKGKLELVTKTLSELLQKIR